MTRTPALTTLIMISLSLAAADREWTTYQPGNGVCYVKFPANPEYQTQMIDASAAHIYIAKDTARKPAFVYTVAFCDYHKEKFTDKDAEKKVLDTDRDSFVRAVNGKVLSEQPVSVGLISGRAIVVSGEEDHARYLVREFVAESRVFQLVACVPKNDIDDPDVAKFFDSFILAKK